MHKTATVNARIDPKLKKSAEHILHKIGLSSAEAIRLLYNQICLEKQLPFALKIPNEITQKAMKEANDGKTQKATNSKHLIDSI